MIKIVNVATGEVTEAADAPAIPAPPPPQVQSLTFAQLMTGLVVESWITEAEGDAWLDGDLPAVMLALIAALPAGQRFGTKARAKRFITADLNDPLVVQLATSQNKLDQLEAFFNTYGAV